MEERGRRQARQVNQQAASPLIVALDCASADSARALVKQLAGLPLAMFKVGSELFTAAGPAFLDELRRQGHRVFLDLKFHDIPNTVAGAVAAAARLGVSLVNVHAAGGLAMMRAAVGAAREGSAATKVIAVTVLTSLAQDDLLRTGIPSTAEEQVLRLAGMAAEAGLDGVVASTREAAVLRRRFPRPFLLVTPGVRPSWAPDSGDQKRVASPAEALGAGADFLVVGRPITASPNPREAAARLLADLRALTSTTGLY